MKYIKFTQIDSVTKISNNRQTSKNGVMFPEIDGLQILFNDITCPCFWYGKVPDSFVDDPENQCWIISDEEFSNYVKACVDTEIYRTKEALIKEEHDVRETVLGKYHTTAAVSGLYKYEQAKAYLDDSTIQAIELQTEADLRGMTVAQLAERIVNNHMWFRNTDAKISGIRGMLQDRLDSFVFDAQNPTESYESLLNSVDIIGTRKEIVFDLGQEEQTEKIIDVTARKYGSDISARLQFLEG